MGGGRRGDEGRRWRSDLSVGSWSSVLVVGVECWRSE